MNTNESTNPTTTRRPKQYGFQPSPYADKKPVTMRLSKEARDLLDTEARSENTSITELVEQIVRQRVLAMPGGEKLSVVDFPVDRDEMRRNQESAHAEIARLVAELDTTRDKWKAATASLEVYSSDAAKFLARAETAEAKLAKSIPLITEKQLPPRPTVEGLYPGWTDKKKKRWDTDTYKHKQWCLDIAEEILDMIYSKE